VLLGFKYAPLKSLENLSFQNFVAILRVYDVGARKKLILAVMMCQAHTRNMSV
jgi:hypothetical protein